MYYCILAEGFEEIEALTVTDVLRRAGVSVKNASVSGEYATARLKTRSPRMMQRA